MRKWSFVGKTVETPVHPGSCSHIHISHFMGRKLNRRFYYRQYFSPLEHQNVSLGFCFLSALATLSQFPVFISKLFKVISGISCD